jgi:Mg-chelatase subunit ChlD
MTTPEFSVEVFQNEYLPFGAREVNAVVTVTSAGSPVQDRAPRTGAAEIMIVDCSGSMSGAKLARAREAAIAAIGLIRDGTAVAIVAGARRAWPVYPADGTMAIVDPAVRAAAAHAVGRLGSRGGTAISAWLRLAREIFQTRPDEIRHAILLTDG